MRKNSLGNRRGAQAVEFALCLPILLMVISATVDFGWYFQQRMTLTTATQQAVRAAALDKSDSYSTVGNAVGQDVWTASGHANTPTFTFTTYDAGGAVVSALPPSVMQGVGTVTIDCLVCFGGLFGDPVSHTSVEYWYEQ